MISVILGALLVGSLYGNYYFYTNLKKAEQAIAQLQSNITALTSQKAAS